MSPRRRIDLETEIQCLEFELDRLDLEIAAEQRLRWRELAPQLEALGFNVSNQPEPRMPHPLQERSEQRMRRYLRDINYYGMVANRGSRTRRSGTGRRTG